MSKEKKPALRWVRLDNAAKIVPSTTGGADTRVFRITCELKEDVDPDTLQSAVAVAARDFPHFGSVLKKGLFWYYLDQSGMYLSKLLYDDISALKGQGLSGIVEDGEQNAFPSCFASHCRDGCKTWCRQQDEQHKSKCHQWCE